MTPSKSLDSTLAPAPHRRRKPTKADRLRDAEITKTLQDTSAPSVKQAAPSLGTVLAPVDAHPQAYGLKVGEEGAGLRCPPGSYVIVEPIAPTGAGLTVLYRKGAGAEIWDLTQNFMPGSFDLAEGSTVVPMVEVISPQSGRRGRISADAFDKAHRIIGVQVPVEVADANRRAPDKLLPMSECPEGMGEYLVDDASPYPAARIGETVIYDPALREPKDGALCVLQWSSGSRSLLLTSHRGPGGNGAAKAWWVDPVNRPGSRALFDIRLKQGLDGGMLFASDGPYTEDMLRARIVGTAVGVLVAGGPGGDRRPVMADQPVSLDPVGDQPIAPLVPDPIMVAIERHVAARLACVGLDDATDRDAYEDAHEARITALTAVESTRPTTVAGLFALARHMKAYLIEDLEPLDYPGTGAECAFRGLLNGCLGLFEDQYPGVDRDWGAFAAQHPGFLPYPQHQPAGLLALDRAIPLEAARLLALAEAEFDRRRLAYVGFHDPEVWPRVAADLRRKMRMDALTLAATGASGVEARA